MILWQCRPHYRNRPLEQRQTAVKPSILKKRSLRNQARARARELAGREERSGCIAKQFLDLPEYHTANTLMLYLSVRDEVCTTDIVHAAMQTTKTVAIPFCRQGELHLFRLEQLSDLEAGMYGIPEPQMELRADPGRVVPAGELDLVLVPGIAFDVRGARCGHGKGYYDKLLPHVSNNADLVALAFDCQVFPEIPVESHDVFMDKIVTETTIHCCDWGDLLSG